MRRNGGNMPHTGDSPLVGEAAVSMSYFNGQKLDVNDHHMQNAANETQDRPSIVSKSGYPDVNDITGITRAGDANDILQNEERGSHPRDAYH